MSIRVPYLMFLGDAPDQLAAKTAQGVVDWRPEKCLGQMKMAGCNADLGLPNMSLEEAYAGGARTLVLGVANRGGIISDSWMEILVAALEMGFDIASGLHQRLIDLPQVVEVATRNGRMLVDARHSTREFSVGTGIPRTGKRILTVGTDCSVGKMYTSLAIDAEMKKRGMKSTFRATGQTGIFITGDGISVDAVVSDFISGSTEWLSPDNGKSVV